MHSLTPKIEEKLVPVAEHVAGSIRLNTHFLMTWLKLFVASSAKYG